MDVTAADLSVLCGIVNAGMQDAAGQLSGLLGENITLAVAHVTISPLEQVLPLLRLGNVQVACIWQQVRGSLDGSAMLLIHPDDSLALTSALLGNVPSLSEAANGVVQHEALTEIANIIVSSCTGALSDRLGMQIALSVPEFFEQKLTSLFDDALADLDAPHADSRAGSRTGGRPHSGPHNWAQVMVMPVAMNAAHQPINSTLVMMLGAESMQVIVRRLQAASSAGLSAQGQA